MSAPSSILPSDRLFSILITFLTPLFLDEANDVATARAAAIELLRAFRIRNSWDLLVVVQVVGFAMAALGSISLSMTDGLSVNAILRCRSNANALQRSSDRARDRLERHQAQDTLPPDIAPLDEAALQDALRDAAAASEAVALAAGVAPAGDPSMQALQAALNELAAREAPHDGAGSALVASSIAPATGPDVAVMQPDPGMRMVFANAMATVAAEFAQEIRHLPPSEQRLHRARISALSEVSQQLSRGEPVSAAFPPGFGPPGGPHGRGPV